MDDRLLIKSALVIDPQSSFHNQKVDLLIHRGIVKKVSKNIQKTGSIRTFQAENLHISQGWFDSSVSFGEPGYEERETLENGLLVAALSGFTTVALNANTSPSPDTGSKIEYFIRKTRDYPVSLLPFGVLTKGGVGVELAELFDMHKCGAVAFNDYKKGLSDPNLLKLAMQYASGFGGLICAFPQTNALSRKAHVNEGKTSVLMGLKGNPKLSEELQISRDLSLLEYVGGKLHIPTISTEKSVALIEQAKAKGLDVSCSVAIHHLVFTDEYMEDFDADFKVLPPLRTSQDVSALKNGLRTGVIDMVTSDHQPLNIELKKVEFERASYGTVGLETAYAVLQKIFDTQDVVTFLTRGKERFGISPTPIDVGHSLNATLFNPETRWGVDINNLRSKSKNCIFKDMSLKGEVHGIYAKGQLKVNSF